MSLSIYFDGSAAPKNPGGIAIFAFKIVQDGVEVHRHAGEVCRGPEATNNIAEWAGCTAGIEYIRKNYPRSSIKIFGDSQLVINQLTGVYACRKPSLQVYKSKCEELLEGVQWEATWVGREMNTDTDQMARDYYEQIKEKETP